MKQTVTFKDLADEVLTYIKTTGRPRSYQVAIAPVRYLTDTFGKWPAYKVLPDCFYSHHVPRIKAIKPNLNLNNQRQFFVQILNLSYRKGLIKVPPVRVIKPSQKKVVGRELSDFEIGSLLKFSINDRIKLQIEMALITGMRLREILYLKWEYIDFQKTTITLPASTTKTKRTRAFPIAKHLADKILSLKHKSKSPYVFPMQSNNQLPACDNKRAWDHTKKDANVKCRFHDLRHTAATRKIRAGIPMAIVSQELGMGEEVLKRIYLHLNVEDMRQSAEAVHLPQVT